MTDTLKPLAVTPFPYPTESMTGLILRTTECNGYESPSAILRYAGMTENEIRSANPPIDKLAILYGRDPDDFCYMGHMSSERSMQRKKWRILNQVIPALYVSIKSAKICPECILEEGYIDGFWDLRHALACPTHGRMAVTHCPACNKPLSWHRQGLLTCKCGHDLSHARGEPVTNPVILDFLELVKRKLPGDTIHIPRLRDRGFPLHEIEKISVATLLGIIGRLQPGSRRKTSFNVPDGISVEMNALKLASGMLSNWPNGLYDFLVTTYHSDSQVGGSTLHRQFHRFCCSFFKSGLPESEIAFLQNAFMSFGNDRWKTKGFIDPRFSNRLNSPNNIVGMKGLAEHLGIMVPTAEMYVKKGIINGEWVDTAKSKRMIFDLTTLPFRKAEGKRHRLRDAAKFLGLPVNLLSSLRKNGTYKITRLAWGIDGYSELDMIEFRERLLSKVPEMEDYDEGVFISVRSISRKKLSDQGVAARIIAAVLDGQIIPVGRCGGEIGDLVLNRVTAMGLIEPKVNSF